MALTSYQTLSNQLDTLQWRLWSRYFQSTLKETVGLFFSFTFLTIILLGLWPSPMLRAALSLLWMGLFVAHLTYGFFWHAWLSGAPTRLAQRIESQYPALRNDITSAIEFGQILSGVHERAHPENESPELMTAHIAQTTVGLETHLKSLESRLSRTPIPAIKHLFLASFTLLLSFMFFSQPTLNEGLLSLVYGVEQTVVGGETANRSNEPLVGRIQIHLNYPNYTGRSPVQMETASGRVEILAGTEIIIKTEALTPVVGANLIFQEGTGGSFEDLEENHLALGMTVSGTTIETSFTPMESGTYTFLLEDEDGRRRVDPIDRMIHVTPDRNPQLRISEPDSFISISNTDAVPFHFIVTDDFGLTSLGFVYHFSGTNPAEHYIHLADLSQMIHFQDSALFDLATLSLLPGEEVTVMIEARDNDIISGPKSGRSQPVRIRILSPEDRHLIIQEEEKALFESLLSLLADYIEHPVDPLMPLPGHWLAGPQTLSQADFIQRHQDVLTFHGRLKLLLTAWRLLLEEATSDPFFLQRDHQLLSGLFERMETELRREESALPLLNESAIRGLLGTSDFVLLKPIRAVQVETTEESILTLDEIISHQQMENLTRTLNALNEAQERLRELLQQYQASQDPEVRAQIERELARLENQLTTLLERLVNQMQQLPEEHFNLDALEDMGMLVDVDSMTDILEQIRAMISSGQLNQALSALDNLQDQVNQLLEQIMDSQEGGTGTISELEQQLGELLGELEDIALQEQEVLEATQNLQENVRARNLESALEALDNAINPLNNRLNFLEDDLEEIAELPGIESLPDSLQEDAGRQLRQLKSHLQQQDVIQATEASNRLLDRLDQLQRTVEQNPQLQELINENETASYEEIHEQVQQIGEELESLIEMSRPRPIAEDWPVLEQLAVGQESITGNLNELISKITELGEDLPLIEREFMPPLNSIEGEMAGAETSLQQRQVPDAINREQRALNELDQLRQEIHQMVARQRMGQQAQTRMNRERVEIPTQPDETPEAFRQELLDAMRESRLEAYDDEIRSYYERLIQ
jgi:hypothetical protein